MVPHRRFHYHASAHALSGELTRPVQRLIEVQAGISLPSTGGAGSASVENFRFDEVVSFKRGYSHVSGSEKREGNKTTHTTHATAVVEGLNILDVVTADRVVARLSSSFEEPRAGMPPATEGKVLLLGSKLENLSIAGWQVDVQFDHDMFLKLGTFADVQKVWNANDGADSALRQTAARVHEALGKDARTLPTELKAEGGMFSSIVKDVHFRVPGIGFAERNPKFIPPGVQPLPQLGRHAYHVVDFGDVFLGEVLCQHGRKTLTMVRIELGSPNGGGFNVGEGSSNGWPPY